MRSKTINKGGNNEMKENKCSLGTIDKEAV